MLTLNEVLNDAAASPGFEDIEVVEANSRGKNGQSPLHWMATLGDPVGIHLLIDAGADINATDEEGNTPLHEAIIWRQTPAAQMLIAHAADTNIRNAAGLTPKEIAESDGFESSSKLFQSPAQG